MCPCPTRTRHPRVQAYHGSSKGGHASSDSRCDRLLIAWRRLGWIYLRCILDEGSSTAGGTARRRCRWFRATSAKRDTFLSRLRFHDSAWSWADDGRQGFTHRFEFSLSAGTPSLDAYGRETTSRGVSFLSSPVFKHLFKRVVEENSKLWWLKYNYIFFRKHNEAMPIQLNRLYFSRGGLLNNDFFLVQPLISNIVNRESLRRALEI